MLLSTVGSGATRTASTFPSRSFRTVVSVIMMLALGATEISGVTCPTANSCAFRLLSSSHLNISVIVVSQGPLLLSFLLSDPTWLFMAHCPSVLELPSVLSVWAQICTPSNLLRMYRNVVNILS